MEIRDINGVIVTFRKALLELDTFLAAVEVNNDEFVLNEHELKMINKIKNMVNSHVVFKK